MKVSRSYLLGLGSGLILSALIAMVVPTVSINFSGDVPPASPAANQNIDSSGDEHESTNESQDKLAPESQKEENLGVDMEETEENAPVNFAIPAGSTADRIADLLLTEGWISSKEKFLKLVKDKGLASRFRAGSYELTPGMSDEEILNQLIQ